MFSVNLKIAKVGDENAAEIANGHSRFVRMIKTASFAFLLLGIHQYLFLFAEERGKGQYLDLPTAGGTRYGIGKVDQTFRKFPRASRAKFG